MRFFALLVILLSANVQAAQFSVTLDSRESLRTEKVNVGPSEFTKISLTGFQSTQTLGEPQLPVKSWLLVGKPGAISVKIEDVRLGQVIKNVQPFPAQEEPCRCPSDKVKTFQFNKDAYAKNSAGYTLEYIGEFRGTPIHRLDLPLAWFDASEASVQMLNSIKVSTNADEFAFQSREYKNYLVLVPEQFSAGVSEFVAWRRSQGFNVTVESLLAPQMTTAAIQTLVKGHYDNQNVDFLVVVGDSTQVPMFNVQTSGDYQTPSDLPYLTMGGTGDYIPDIFASRVVANSVEDVATRLNKVSEFELKSAKNIQGLRRVIGISSNEGSSPSDEEYVESINTKFRDVLGLTTTHLTQDNQDSTPAVLNSGLDQGAMWLTYLGHGSGTSWPSMSQEYNMSHVDQLRNIDSVKPVIVDVACMNGRVEKGYLGDKFAGVWMNESTQPFGASAYYGGTVNISWHPPAIMARGVAFEHMAKNFRYLGEALLAGQLYLAANYASKEAIVDNMEWYHLQGDPGMAISY